jgi:glutamate dehydrogenase
MVAKPETGLGILRGDRQDLETRLPPEAVALLESNELVLVTKAMTRATVHRPAWLDYVAVKRFDAAGQVIGEARFLGLYTATAYTAAVGEIPQVRSRVASVMTAAGVVPDSHAAKSLQSILDVYPRDELFQIDTATLTEHAIGILRLQERQRTRLFLRRDPFGRFTSALVFVPRDRFNTELRIKIGNELMAALDGQSIEFTPMLTDSPLARIHYLVRASEQRPAECQYAALEVRITRLTQRWEDDCTTELLRAHGEGPGLALAHRFADAFSTSYREDFSAQVAAEDATCAGRPFGCGAIGRQAVPPAGCADRACCASRFTTRPRWRCPTRCRCWSAWAPGCWTNTPTASATTATRCGFTTWACNCQPTPTWPPSRTALKPCLPPPGVARSKVTT